MRRIAAFAIAAMLLASPCFAQETEAPAKPAQTQTKIKKSSSMAATPVKIEANKVKISPANSKITFIGTHVGPTPDPKARPGGFNKFDGAIELAEDGKSIKSIKIDIDTTSIATPMAKLTGHLKAGDFFNVEKFKKAQFTSTKIEAGTKEDTFKITGTMKMLGTEKEMVIPATVKISDDGLMLKSTFMFDRTDHGMDKMAKKVNKQVAVSFVIGEKTMAKSSSQKDRPRRGSRGNR